jgi:hypothetical protein
LRSAHDIVIEHIKDREVIIAVELVCESWALCRRV